MLLTVAIPSHNSTDLLYAAINSLALDPSFGLRFDICISDNSIDDNTNKLCLDKYSTNPNIHYYRSVDCVSLDENVNKVVELSRGTYVWIFGDDDLLVPGVLNHLLDFLAVSNPDLVILNSQSFFSDQTIEISRLPPGVQSVYTPAESNDFLADLGGYLTYVGSILVRRDLWVQYYDHGQIGSYFAHISAVCAIKQGRSAHVFSTPIIRMRMHSQTWTNRSFLIWNSYFPNLIWSLPGYSMQAKVSVSPLRPIHSPLRMIAARAYGTLSTSVWAQVILPSRDVAPIFKLYTLFLSLLPRLPFRVLYRFHIILFRNRHTRRFSPALALSQL